MSKVVQAEIRIGSDAGIVEESFVFGFNVLAGQGPTTEDMKLVISHDDGIDLMRSNSSEPGPAPATFTRPQLRPLPSVRQSAEPRNSPRFRHF